MYDRLQVWMRPCQYTAQTELAYVQPTLYEWGPSSTENLQIRSVSLETIQLCAAYFAETV